MKVMGFLTKITPGGRLLVILGVWACFFSLEAAGGPPWKSAPVVKTSASGLAYIYQQDDTSALTVVEIFIRGGRGAVPPGKDGLAYITSRLALEIPDSGKVQDLMKQSSRLFVAAREDYCLISLECLSDNLPDLLRVSSEIILDPLFSGLRIDGIKDFMRHEARIEEDDGVSAGHKAAMSALWGGLGYGGSNFGDKESLKSIAKKDIADYYGRLFTKKMTVFSIVSDQGENDVVSKLEKYFAGLPSGREERTASPGEARLPDDRDIHIVKDQKQCYMARVCALPPLSARGYALGFLLETLLGKGVGSRLWELRFKEKLAYNVNARASLMANGGLFEAYLETDNRKKGTARAMLREAVDGLFAEGLTVEELQITKVLAKAQFLRANETKSARARTLGYFEVAGLGAGYLSGFFDELEDLTLDEVNAYIRGVLDPEKAVWVTVGPADTAP